MNLHLPFENNRKPVPLVYPEITPLNTYTNILFIDNSVKEYQTFVDSVNANTFPIVYSVSSLKTEVLTLLQTNFTSISRIGLVFVSSFETPKMFMDFKPLFNNEELEPYSKNLQFIIDVIKQFQVKNIDYLACNTLNYPNYVNYYDLLKTATGVIIGASNDKTGNIQYGGDWIMESTSQDIEFIYFTQSIKYYSYLLDSTIFGTTGLYPYGITIDSAGNIYTANSGSNNVTKITPQGVSSILGTTGTNPYGITIDSAGNIYTANLLSNNVTKITPQGVSTIFGTTGSTPNQITIDSAGNVYTANQSSNDVTKITPQGVSSILGTTGSTPNEIIIDFEQLRKGDLVKTLKHSFKRIDLIGKREIHHLGYKERIKEQLYCCSQDDFEEVFEPLIITGCHSILVDEFISEEQRTLTKEVNGKIYITDNKYRLPACLDLRASVYPEPGTYTIYHLALENDDYYMNYGIYANGLLVETCSKRYLKELSGMELIEE